MFGAQPMKGWAHAFSFTALSFSIGLTVLDGKDQVRTHDLPATFYIITKSL